MKPSRQFTPLELDETIFVSAVPTWVRIARSVEGRALNRIFRRDAIIGMKIRILSLAPSDDEVRDRIDTMSHHELGLWIHHHEIAEKQVRLAEAKRLLEKEADTKFLRRVDELKAYKEKHNNLNVHKREDKSLYQFCASLKSARRAIISGIGTVCYRLNDDRIGALDAIGFDWNLSAGDLIKANSASTSVALDTQFQATTATTNNVRTSPVVAAPGSSSSTDGVAAAAATLAPSNARQPVDVPLLP